MQLIRCTKKLQKEMGLKKNDISTQEPDGANLGSWHANLIYIDGKKCILFVNDKTLFNFIATNVKRAEIKELSNLFKTTLKFMLETNKIPENVKSEFMQEYESIQYANTNNKSVMGSMNDYAYHYKDYIQTRGGLKIADTLFIIHSLNNMPMGALKYNNSYEELAKLIETMNA
ncbi:MAG: hypothetical protein PF692_05335 [Kiritimatiellae bacterium]|jgi:hypothetical protein|nr:hypothetical protein [Kiritimatiellia bacterium]